MLAFRNGARPKLYDNLELNTTVQQIIFLHQSHRGIVCIIHPGVAENFLAVLVLFWSKALNGELSVQRQDNEYSDAGLSGLWLWGGGKLGPPKKRCEALCEFDPVRGEKS